MFLTRRFYFVSTVVVLLLAGGFAWHPLFVAGRAMACAVAGLAVAETVLLWWGSRITASRQCADRFSNGDDNEVVLSLHSHYAFGVWLEVIDEAPTVFQRRDIVFRTRLTAAGETTLAYRLRPVGRGADAFGHIRVFVSTRVGFVQRRYTLGEPQEVKVYPSYRMLRRYEFLAMHNRLNEMGIKKVRRAGNNTEFDQIKDYVKGDDFRHINWKASARKHQLMVNVYTEERSQPIYSVIDKGRMMQQTFRGMTYLDHAINAALMLSFVALYKEDRAGLITFSEKLGSLVPAGRKPGHMETLLDTLYRQTTTFGETDFSALVAHVDARLSQRSLLVLYTNFATLDAMRRQLPYLQQLGRHHRVLVVFFNDAEIQQYADTAPTSTEEYYRHVVAEKTIDDQRRIVAALKQQGILALLTTPENLSVDVINQYLELKARHLLG